MISVKWAVSSDQNYVPAATAGETTMLPDWAGAPSNATTAAEHICAEHFDTMKWDACFALDEDDFTVYLTILEPAEIAGTFEVYLERITSAKARQMRTAPEIRAERGKK